jgi:hypothetical protein
LLCASAIAALATGAGGGESSRPREELQQPKQSTIESTQNPPLRGGLSHLCLQLLQLVAKNLQLSFVDAGLALLRGQQLGGMLAAEIVQSTHMKLVRFEQLPRGHIQLHS